MYADAGYVGQVPFRPGNGEMYLARDQIGEIVKNQRRVVRDDGVRNSQPCGHDILMLRTWEVPQPIEPSPLAEELPGSQVILDEVVAESHASGLLGREIARLRLRQGEQLVISSIEHNVIHFRNFTTTMGDMLLVHSAPVSQFRSLPTENDDYRASTLVRLEELVHIQTQRVRLDAGYVEAYVDKTDEWRIIPLSPETVEICRTI